MYANTDVSNKNNIPNKTNIIDLSDYSLEHFNYLKNKKLFKSLTIMWAHKVGIPVPRSYVVMEPYNIDLNWIKEKVGNKIMVRVDYATRNNCKPLGGIILYNINIFTKLAKYIFNLGYYPLINEADGISRFENIYSVNVLFRGSYVYLEIVGKGFDASDLRLGEVVPHELVVLNTRNEIIHHKIIDVSDYRKTVQYRRKKIRLLQAHEKFMNDTGLILSKLDECVLSFYLDEEKDIDIPQRYEPISDKYISELKTYISLIKSNLYELPASKEYIATFTLFRNYGWLLWDVFGYWYYR